MFVKTIDQKLIPSLLDRVDAYCSNELYQRVQFDKYVSERDQNHPCIWYGIFDGEILCALAAVKFGYPAGDIALLAEVQSFVHGYGRPLIRYLVDRHENIWWAADNSRGYDMEENLLAYYRNFGLQEYFLDSSKWVDGRHQHFFYKASDEAHAQSMIANIEKARSTGLTANITVDKIRQIFDETVYDYKNLFGFDMSYMRLKVSRDNEYVDGNPCYDYAPDEWAGTHTRLGYIIINPELELSMRRHGFQDTIEEFAKIIIAHELAHEIWLNPVLADVEFKQKILFAAVESNFQTSYLQEVSEEKLGQETFCEYMADLILKNGSKLSIVSESADGFKPKMEEVSFEQARKDFKSIDLGAGGLDKSIIKKALDWPSNDSLVYELKTDDGKIGAMLVLRTEYGPGAYVHELVGFERGYGKELLRQVCGHYKKVWLQCALLGDGEETPYGPNTGLRDKLYRRCDFLKEYIVKNSEWNCEASFFYTGIPDGTMSKYLERNFGK